MRIAVLEDSLDQAHWMVNMLSQAGHACHHFTSGRDLLHVLSRETFDLLILDWQVPEVSGEKVLQWIRQNIAAHVPVIFVTAYTRDVDIMSILNSGADDYIVKPVSPGVLLARVGSLLRRAYGTDSSTMLEVFGDFEFDLPLEQVRRRGVPMTLTQREFALALLLFRNLGRPLARAHILEAVWRRVTDVPSRTMDTHISNVRTKLGLRPENGYRIASVYGYGYRLERISAVDPRSE